MLCAFNVSTVISFDQANPMASVNVWIKRKPGYYVRVGTSHVHTYTCRRPSQRPYNCTLHLEQLEDDLAACVCINGSAGTTCNLHVHVGAALRCAGFLHACVVYDSSLTHKNMTRHLPCGAAQASSCLRC